MTARRLAAPERSPRPSGRSSARSTRRTSDGTRLWNTSTRALVDVLRCRTSLRSGPTVGGWPCGQWLRQTTGSSDAAVDHELVSGRAPSTFPTVDLEQYQGSRPAFDPNGRSIAVPSFDGTTAIWDLEPVHRLAAACQLVGATS